MLILSGLLATCFISCNPSEPSPPSTTIQEYLFLGHPYNWQFTDRIDPRLELLDYSRFQGIWLGGDVCARTTKSEATLTYLDSLFQLKSPSTHWAWGNHDLMEGDERRLLAATGRNDYYTERLAGGLQLIVLNTNLFWHNPWNPPSEDCTRKEAQLSWLHEVLDTINAANQLLILHHHGLLNEFKTADSSAVATNEWGNVDAPLVRVDCRPEGDFTQEFYPQLVAIRRKGIPVTLVSGDVGMRSKGYALQTPEGIDLLGSGINNSLDMTYPPDYVTNFNPDSVLVFRHDVERQQLDWSFVHLGELLKEQLSDRQYQTLSPEVRRLVEGY